MAQKINTGDDVAVRGFDVSGRVVRSVRVSGCATSSHLVRYPNGHEHWSRSDELEKLERLDPTQW